MIELMVAIGIIAIIVSIGLPSLLKYRQRAQLGNATREVYGGLQKAKMEATRHNRLCVFKLGPLNFDGTAYDWHVFRDEDRDFVFDAGTDTFVIGYIGDDYPGVLLDNDKSAGGNDFPDADDGTPALAFGPDGLPVRILAGNLIIDSGSIFFKDSGDDGREVNVSLVGNIQITKYKAN